MGLIRFFMWTGVSIGVGVGLATVEVGGRTPLMHLERLWKHERPKLERASHDAVAEVKKKVSSKDVVGGGGGASGPKEQHSAADRSAIDEIIGKRPHP